MRFALIGLHRIIERQVYRAYRQAGIDTELPFNSWILLRITGQEMRNKLTECLAASHLFSRDSLILRLVLDDADDAVRHR